VAEVRGDAIMATGRSDYGNQINNVLGFPYIFRGALDVRASTINMEMKVAAAEALAALAREDVPDEVSRAYAGQRLRYGPEYIIPAPFDPRLIVVVPKAVAAAAVQTGVARRPIEDMDAYEQELLARLDPTAASLQNLFEEVRAKPRRVVFAEGEESKSIRAALAFHGAGYGTPLLVGREDRVRETLNSMGLESDSVEVHNARLSDHNAAYTDYLFKRLQRKGHLYRDCQRMVNQNPLSRLPAHGEPEPQCLCRLHGRARSRGRHGHGIDSQFQRRLRGHSARLGSEGGAQGLWSFRHRHARPHGVSRRHYGPRTAGPGAAHELPDPEQLADIAIQSAAQARAMGHEPRVALLSYSNFGNPLRETAKRVRDAVAVLDSRLVDFEYDGEMQANVALDGELMRELYPFCRLSGPANVLIMPALHTANISAKLLQKLGGSHVIGPLLIGMSKPAQIVPLGATVNDLVTVAALAAYDAITESTLL
jgi:malate dehydrogenase (oxaloacetate-decarboxylating)(NADP+)